MATRSAPLLLLALLAPAAAPAPAAERPNVVLVLADDLGYADLGCQGVLEEVRTPHLDRLAAEGVRMTSGYVTAPQCTPSRAAILTGRAALRFGLEWNQSGPLPLDEPTLAERMRAGGYATGYVGKWHLDPNGSQADWLERNLPRLDLSRSSEIPLETKAPWMPQARGFTDVVCGVTDPYWATFDPLGQVELEEGRLLRDPRDRFEVMTEAAERFLERHADEPFLLCVSYSGPHPPLEASPEHLARFEGVEPERRRLGLAMTAAIDDGVGRILAALERHELDERTLVVFLSDHGSTAPKAGGRAAVSSNEPWLGGKGTLLEGGLRVPFLARWSGTLPAGTVYDEPVSSLDVAATALTAAGLRTAGLDGVDLLPFWTGERAEPPHARLFWLWRSQEAVREGRWKLLRLQGEETRLFDLASAAGERADVAAEHPERVARLAGELDRWRAEVGLAERAPEDARAELPAALEEVRAGWGAAGE